MSLSAILTGLETRLLTIPDMTVSRFSAQQVTPPHAVIGIPSVEEYRSTMGRGYWTPTFTVTLFASTADSEYGQDLLLSFAEISGPNSVVQAIEGDRTLGGTVADCIVTGFSPSGLESVGGLEFYTGEFSLMTIAQGG